MLIVHDFYKLKIESYAVRSLLKSGITRLAQIHELSADHNKKTIKMREKILSNNKTTNLAKC
jgi:putative colanic acid biosynthesis UDP-glucose lipid carrier transferase